MRTYDRLGRQIVSTDAIDTCWVKSDDGLKFYAVCVQLVTGLDEAGQPTLVPALYVSEDMSGNARIKNGSWQIQCNQTRLFHTLYVKLVDGLDEAGNPTKMPALYCSDTGET